MSKLKITKNGFYLFTVFLYLFFLSFLNFTIFYQVAALIMIVTSIYKCLTTLQLKSSPYFIFQLVFIVYIAAYIPLGLTINVNSTISAIKTIGFNLLINFALFNLIDSKENLFRILKMFIPIAIFSGIYIIIISGGGGIDGRLGHGITRPFADASQTYTSMEFASWSLYAATFCLFFYLTEKKKVYLIPIPFYWVIILWAGSRKWALFGIIIYIFVFVFCDERKNLRQKMHRLFAILLFLLFLFMLMINVPMFYETIGSRIVGFFNGTESSASTRQIMLETAFNYISKNPFFGYGFNTFRNISIFETWSECNYTELLFGGGIPLFILFYGYEIGLAKTLFIHRKENKLFVLFLGIILMLISSDYISVSYQDRLASLIITLCSFSVFQYKKTISQKEYIL